MVEQEGNVVCRRAGKEIISPGKVEPSNYHLCNKEQQAYIMEHIIVFHMTNIFIEFFIFNIFWSCEFNFYSLSSEYVSHHPLRSEMEQSVCEKHFPTLLTVFLSFS